MLLISASPWVYRYLTQIIPRVDTQLLNIKNVAASITDPLLRCQAQNSIKDKSFHCYGGSVLSLLAPENRRDDITAFIVAFQTISDYLDNLCDRSGIVDENAFFLLHQAMLDAASPGRSFGDYYSLYAGHSEEEYLPFLVSFCREKISSLPSFSNVRSHVAELIRHYSKLQAIKHLLPVRRREKLKKYIETAVPNPFGLNWWELAGAIGSTLGVFSLVSLSAYPDFLPEKVSEINRAYFPWICGLHILLDYLIDQEEDRQAGDLNFVSYYPSEKEKWNSIYAFFNKSSCLAARLPGAPIHNLVVSGLLALYFSDPKVKKQGLLEPALSIINKSGWETRILFQLCRLVRRIKKI